MTTEPEPVEVVVALPLGTLRLLTGSIIVAIVLMLFILAFEIVILFRVSDILDLLERVLPGV
jgi:hypothetical protein